MSATILQALLLSIAGQFYQVDTDGDGDPDAYQWVGTAEWRLGSAAGSAAQCLCSNGAGASPTWQTVSGSGGISGPGSSTDNAIVRWDGTGGTTVQNSVVTVSDTGVIAGAVEVQVADNTSNVLRIIEGVTPYLAFTTTNGAEALAIGSSGNPDVSVTCDAFQTSAQTGINMSTASGQVTIQATTGQMTFTAGNDLSLSIPDNDTLALRLRQGTDDYLLVNTTNTTERITLGNATINPDLTWAGAGDWNIGGSVGSSGQCLISGGSGASPSWQSCDQGSYTTVQDEGSSLTARRNINFIGGVVSCVDNAGSSRTDCTVSSGYATVQDEGSGLTARSTINFTGAGVSCVDNAGSSRTDCTISGGGGGGGSGNTGTTTVDFGAYPADPIATAVIAGETGILSGSVVQAWIYPTDTADHTLDEHLLVNMKVRAHSIVAGDGFTITAYFEGSGIQGLGKGSPVRRGNYPALVGESTYGEWSVAWRWQ